MEVIIDHPSFDVKIFANEFIMDFAVFDKMNRKYFTKKLTKDKLSQRVITLFKNIQGLAEFFQEISSRVSNQNYKNIQLQQNELIIMETISGGDGMINMHFTLDKVDVFQSITLLKDMLYRQESQLKRLRNLCDHQYKIQDKNLDTKKFLDNQLQNALKEEFLLNKAKKEKENSLEKMDLNIQRKMEYLRQLNCMCPKEQFETEVGDIFEEKIHLCFKSQKYIEVSENFIQANLLQSFSPIELKSQKQIPLFGKFFFTLKVEFLQHGISIGVLAQDHKSQNSLYINTYTKTIHISGLKKSMTKFSQIRKGDELKVSIDRQSNTIQFFHNMNSLQFREFPQNMRGKRLYPYLIFEGNAQLQIKTEIDMQIE